MGVPDEIDVRGRSKGGLRMDGEELDETFVAGSGMGEGGGQGGASDPEEAAHLLDEFRLTEGGSVEGGGGGVAAAVGEDGPLDGVG